MLLKICIYKERGRLFDDYCNWQRLPALKQVIFESEAGRVAAALMRSQSAQLFHDHVLVKEPGTAKQTPWHQGQKLRRDWFPIIWQNE